MALVIGPHIADYAYEIDTINNAGAIKLTGYGITRANVGPERKVGDVWYYLKKPDYVYVPKDKHQTRFRSTAFVKADDWASWIKDRTKSWNYLLWKGTIHDIDDAPPALEEAPLKDGLEWLQINQGGYVDIAKASGALLGGVVANWGDVPRQEYWLFETGTANREVLTLRRHPQFPEGATSKDGVQKRLDNLSARRKFDSAQFLVKFEAPIEVPPEASKALNEGE